MPAGANCRSYSARTCVFVQHSQSCVHTALAQQFSYSVSPGMFIKRSYRTVRIALAVLFVHHWHMRVRTALTKLCSYSARSAVRTVLPLDCSYSARVRTVGLEVVVVVVDRFYIALFSALEQIHCTRL